MISKISRNFISSSKILMTHQNYIFKMIQLPHIEGTIDILTNSFNNQEPLTNAYFRSFPLQQDKRIKKWVQLWGLFADDFSTNKISVGCFDAEKGDELVGVSIAKDLQFAPEGLESNYLQDLNFVSPVIGVEEHLIHQADQKWRPLLTKKGVLMDIWGVAVRKQHSGKRILGKMMESNMLLGQASGYSHAFCFAANFKTSLALQRLKFEKIAEESVEDFEIFGERPFKQIEEVNKYPKLWIKKLGHLDNSL